MMNIKFPVNTHTFGREYTLHIVLRVLRINEYNSNESVTQLATV